MQMDVIDLLSKVEGLPDVPITDPDEVYQPATIYFANGLVVERLIHLASHRQCSPKIHEYVKEMNKKVLSSKSLDELSLLVSLITIVATRTRLDHNW